MERIGGRRIGSFGELLPPYMVFRCHFVFSPLACYWCLCLALYLLGQQPRLDSREQEGLAGTL